MRRQVEIDSDWGTVDIHATETGSGARAVVLVHGWATTSTVWQPLLARWPADFGRAVAIDLPGVGWSSKPEGGYTLSRWAACVAGVVQQLAAEDDVEEVILVGHSMGGTICQLAASSLQEVIDKLVLLSPVPASGVPLPDAAVAGFKSLAGTRGGMAQVLDSMMAGEVDSTERAMLVAAAASVSPTAYREGLDAWRTADFADRLADLGVPTQVFCGADEQPLSPDLLRATVLAQIPGSTLQTLPGVGHYPQLEGCDALMSALRGAIVG